MEQLILEELAPARRDAGRDVTAPEAIVDLTESTDTTESTGAAQPPDAMDDPHPDYLSPRDRRILALERQWFCNAGSKEAEISRQFAMTPTRYFQILNHLIDDPRAMRESPQLVFRLRRLRAMRQQNRRRHRRVLRNGH